MFGTSVACGSRTGGVAEASFLLHLPDWRYWRLQGFLWDSKAWFVQHECCECVMKCVWGSSTSVCVCLGQECSWKANFPSTYQGLQTHDPAICDSGPYLELLGGLHAEYFPLGAFDIECWISKQHKSTLEKCSSVEKCQVFQQTERILELKERQFPWTSGSSEIRGSFLLLWRLLL